MFEWCSMHNTLIFKKQSTRLLFESWPIIQAIMLLNYFSMVHLEQKSQHCSLQLSWYFLVWAKEKEKRNLKMQIRIAWKIMKSELLAWKSAYVLMYVTMHTSLKLWSLYVCHVCKLLKPGLADFISSSNSVLVSRINNRMALVLTC